MPRACLAASAVIPCGPPIVHILAMIAGVRDGGMRSCGTRRGRRRGSEQSRSQLDTDDTGGTFNIAHSKNCKTGVKEQAPCQERQLKVFKGFGTSTGAGC